MDACDDWVVIVVTILYDSLPNWVGFLKYHELNTHFQPARGYIKKERDRDVGIQGNREETGM